MLIQIYEVATPDEAAVISAIGVEHIGVLVGDGRFSRELSLTAAQPVVAAVRPPSVVSLLFLSPDLALIEQWTRALCPAIIHLGAAAELLVPADVEMLKRHLPGVRLMRSIPIIGEASLDLATAYDGIADFLLLDSYSPADRQIGALGIPHDWDISRRIVQRVRTPVLLAGGLGPDNVAAAIRHVQPAGVDSKTRTDVDGSHRKDLDRVRRFYAAARAAGLPR